MLSEINKAIKEAATAQGFEVPASGKDHDNKENSFSIEDQLLSDVRAELSRHVYKFTRLSPPRLTIAHSDDKKIFHAYIKNRKNDDEEEKNSSRMQYLKLTDVIIDAIPKNVIIYDSPVGDKNRKLEIQFESRSTKHSFTTGPGTINSIIDELQNRNMLIKKSAALDALTAIVGAFERDGKAIINDNVTTPGYYLVDGKLAAYEVTQSIASWPEQSEVVQCVDILDELAKRYKNKDIFPTAIKWAIVAPFSYALKGVDNNNWIPWLQPYGIKVRQVHTRCHSTYSMEKAY